MGLREVLEVSSRRLRGFLEASSRGLRGVFLFSQGGELIGRCLETALMGLRVV